MAEQPLEIDISQKIEDRLKALDRYILINGVSSYDPYDGLCSPLAGFAVKFQLLLRIWQQAVRYFPLNIRPLLGINKMAHTKTVSDLASSYALLYNHQVGEDNREKCLQYLKQLEYLRVKTCLLYTSPSPRDRQKSRMPSSA